MSGVVHNMGVPDLQFLLPDLGRFLSQAPSLTRAVGLDVGRHVFRWVAVACVPDTARLSFCFCTYACV
jgi:hypothetical protein